MIARLAKILATAWLLPRAAVVLALFASAFLLAECGDESQKNADLSQELAK